MKQDTKKIFLKTFGCQMNEHDSEIIASMMIDDGYAPVSSADEAELIIYNTCSVRKHAEDRVWGNLGELLRNKEKGKSKKEKEGNRVSKIIGLVGCMAKAHGKEAFKRIPQIDFVCSPANIYDMPELVEKVKSGKRHIAAIGNKQRPLKEYKGGYRADKVKAYVNISEGCNNFCSYCIVPYVRGSEVSRPQGDIIDEVKQLVDTGVKEIMFLGQNVNSYQLSAFSSQLSAKGGFVRLLEKINDIDGLERIRFMTSHPKDAGPELFKAMRDLEKVCEHIHLPLQSGSDRILEKMNRGYTAGHYLKLIDSLRKYIPDCAVTTDIIVGFPTEADKDFMDTNMLMKHIEFNSAFIFKYSSRPFTKAALLEDDVPPEVKLQRNHSLLELQSAITTKKNESLIGNIEESLGVGRARRSPSTASDSAGYYIKGRTRKNSQVIYKGDKHLIGILCGVKIKAVEEHTLIGELA